MKGAFRGPLKARSPHQQYVAGGVGDFPRAAPLPVVTNVKPPLSFEDEKAYEISIARAIPVIEKLFRQSRAVVSIDTNSPAPSRAA